MTITDPETFMVDSNASSINIRLNTINVDIDDEFMNQYVFAILVPDGNFTTIDMLQWNVPYQWNDDNIQLLNDITRHKRSKVDDSQFLSPLFIPLKLESDDDKWSISNSIDWDITLNFTDFIHSLIDSPEYLSFDIFLITFKFKDNINSNKFNKSLTMRVSDANFVDNYADILSTIYINEDAYYNVNVTMKNVDFRHNVAPGLTSFAIDSHGPQFEEDDVNHVIRQIHCDGCNFENNIAYSSGTCFNILGDGATLSCSDCLFTSNYAKQMGAVIYVRDGSLTLIRSQIKDNHSPLGANVLVDNSKLFLFHSIFDRNTAIYGGGAAVIINNIDQLILNELDMITYDDLIKIDNCLFANNLAKTAGSIYIPITGSTYRSSASSTGNIGRRLLQTVTIEPIVDSVIIETENKGSCAGLEIIIDPDFHSQDISWIVQFDNDYNKTMNKDTMYGCITSIPSSVQCITFQIEDSFGDGLNYGEGEYFISWKGREWSSKSWGNYGSSESLTICPSQFVETQTLTVFVQIQDDASLQVLQFLRDELLPLLDDTVGYNVVFDIEDENIADNTTCLNCQYNYCVCDATTNITMENVIAALCYYQTAALRNMYNYTWEEFWNDDIDFINTTMNDYCFNNIDTLLDDNYALIQKFISTSAPSFYMDSESGPNIISLTSYLESISTTIMYSNCDLYSKLYDIINPICDSLIASGSRPPLCQADNCYSSYCNTTETYFSFAGNTTNGYKILDYSPYKFDGIVGSQMLNIKHTMSKVYGMEEYYTSSLECFNGTNIAEDDINDTIPVLAVHLDTCNYIELITRFQDFGARAVVLVTNIDKRSTPSPTMANSDNELNELNYHLWLPYECHIRFLPSITNYSDEFLSVKWQIDSQIANVLETNIIENETDAGASSIIYRINANTTFSNFVVPDRFISDYLARYLQTDLSLGIDFVQCAHGNEVNESYTNAPTSKPTEEPTTSPSKRSIVYDEIYIPIELVTAVDAQQLIQAYSDGEQLEIGFLCDSIAPTPSPFGTGDPTPIPTPPPTSTLITDEREEFVIFVYETWNATKLSMGISFPNLLNSPLAGFRPVYEQLCQFPFGIDEIDTNNDEYVYFVTVDTMFNEFESICIELNDDTNTMITGWKEIDDGDDSSMYWSTIKTDNSAENGCASNIKYSRTNIGLKPRGTYCVALYTNKDDYSKNKRYNLRIKQIFNWTEPFISIQRSAFINNTVTKGKGGAITIITDVDRYEFVSIWINDTIFDSNYAALGGGSIYRGSSETNYDSNYIQMSILEMTNIQIYNSIAQNTYGGSLMTELFTTEIDGLIFRNVISISNMTLRMATSSGISNSTNNTTILFSGHDGYGGAIYSRDTILYIAYSRISNGYAWDGGCIWAQDTALTLYESVISNCTASNDGGGLNIAESTKYASYDLCLSSYYTDFAYNEAVNDGGGAFLRLHGMTSDSRESCIKLFDVSFKNNHILEGEGEYIYLEVKDGYHNLLNGKAPFGVICDEDKCKQSSGSTLVYLCASTIAAECKQYSRSVIDYVPNVTVSGIPGSSGTLYIYGFAIHYNDLNTTQYDILVTAEKATIINPTGTSSSRNKHYIVPFVIDIGEKDAVGTITLSDQNYVAASIEITLIIKQCDPGYYQKPNEIDDNLFSCELCDAELYTLKTDKCKPCEQGLFCYGGNNIVVEENFYAKQGISVVDEYIINVTNSNKSEYRSDDGSYVITALCPPRYCCNSPTGCNFHDKTSLCALNRDPNAVLCGKCLPGFFETLSSSGACAKCESGNEWIIAIIFILGFAAIYFFYLMGKKEKRDRPHPLMPYVMKTLLFFYQVLSFLTFRSSSQILRPIAELVNLNIDVSEGGTCFFKEMNARMKLWLNLVVPAILIIAMLIFYLIIRIIAKRKTFPEIIDEEEKQKERQKFLESELIALQSSMWAMFLIVYVQITTAFIKLSMCIPFGDDGEWYMWYAGSVKCFDAGHYISLFLGFLLVFCVPFLMLRFMKYYKNMEDQTKYKKILAPLTLSYSERCWFYSSFNIFRRAILIVLPLVPNNNLSIRASFITFTVGLLLAVHCYLMPFYWSSNNHLETFVLIIAFFISTLNIVNDPPYWFRILTAILALSPLLPCILLFHDFATIKARFVTEKLPKLTFVVESYENNETKTPQDNEDSATGAGIFTVTGAGDVGIEMMPSVPKKKSKDAVHLYDAIGGTANDGDDEDSDDDSINADNEDSGKLAKYSLISHDSDEEDNVVNQNKNARKRKKTAEMPWIGGKLAMYRRKRSDEDISLLQETLGNGKHGENRNWISGSLAWLNKYNATHGEKDKTMNDNDIDYDDMTANRLLTISNKKQIHSGLLSPPTSLYKIASDGDGDGDGDSTMFSIVRIRQQPWKSDHGDIEIVHEYSKEDSDDSMMNYVVPNEYLYIDGSYSPKIFDEKFKSMVYVHNNNICLEMGVSSYGQRTGKNKGSLQVTWLISDIKKKCGLYESDKGSLSKPPIKGWKRLIDNDDSKTNINEDLKVDLISKDMKHDSMPPPEIVDLSCNTSHAIMIEYDYKQLVVEDAPNLQQWVEIIAHNITDSNSLDMIKIIYIKNEEEEKKDANNLSLRAYEILQENKELADRDKQLKKPNWIRTKFEFDKLKLQQEYRFSIKLSNCITFAESKLSEPIIPMTLPDGGTIKCVRCDAYTSALFIECSYDKTLYENKSMIPLTFSIVVTPWPGKDAFDRNLFNYFEIDQDNKKVIISHKPTLRKNNYDFEQLVVSNIRFGQEYNIVFEAKNSIGITPCKAIKYCPLRVPPKPIIDSVETDEKEWKMTINVSCPGYNDKDCKAWYELELIHRELEDIDDFQDETKIDLMSDVDEDGYIIDDEKMKDSKSKPIINNNSYESELDADLLKVLRSKHYESPIVVTPIFAGQTYLIKVKCVNICAISESDEYEAIMVKTAPSIPIFKSSQAFDGSVVIGYQCENYKYYRGYEPIFEIKISPFNVKRTPKPTKLTKQRVEGLRNGDDYQFKIRAKNKLGQSDWSDILKLKPLKKPQQPIELRTVSGDQCITILWVSTDTGNMKKPEICGKFVIISDPPTIEQKTQKNIIEFQGLDNETEYKFQIIALNDNFRIESEWTTPRKPEHGKTKINYKKERLNVIEEIKKKIKSGRKISNDSNDENQEIDKLKQKNVEIPDVLVMHSEFT